MRIKEDPKPVSKLFMISKKENESIKKLAKQLKTYESEILREALREYLVKNGMEI